MCISFGTHSWLDSAILLLCTLLIQQYYISRAGFCNKMKRVSLTNSTDSPSDLGSLRTTVYQFSTLAQILQVYSSGSGKTNAQSYPPKEAVVAGSADFCSNDIASDRRGQFNAWGRQTMVKVQRQFTLRMRNFSRPAPSYYVRSIL